ncbi:hypothetical protein JW968_02030 [Candidatus Woesearchaeota archaeon]|nr:hypothetical protein [Candidatus Woesearchaeota archaeon]
MKLQPEDAESLLVQAKQEHHFKLHMGADIGSLKELADALEIMNDTSFGHHVNQHKNDFAVWVEEVIGDKELASEIKHVKERAKMLKKVQKRIIYLESKKEEGMPIHTRESMWIGSRDFLVGMVLGFVIGYIIRNIVWLYGI